MEWGTDHYDMDDAIMWTLIEGSDYNISLPSGVIIVDETLLVTDNATGIIHAFDLEGNRIDWLDTGLGEGALMGIEALDLDNIWCVDAATDRVLRIQPHKK
jgi:sugar lactone lactonase YvrE